MQACPDDIALAHFVDGGAPSEALEAHVAECEICRAAIAVLAKGKPLASTTSEAPVRVSSPLFLMRGARVGRYEVIECVGAGGMGVVYSARDPKLDRKLALKVVRNASVSSETRLLREAQAMARLSHPNVVSVYDVIWHDADLVVVMELVRGTTLDQWSAKPHAWTEIADVFVQAGRGLAAAHKAGLVHRDFKPTNVFVRDDGRVQVGDFGLARLIDSYDPTSAPSHQSPLGADVTQKGTLLGTPKYMAPEQRVGHANAQSDQYSFCVALQEAVEKVAAPADIARIALRGTRETPAERYPTMSELVADLEQARSPRTPKRSLWLPIGAVLAAAAIALVAWGVMRSRAATPTVTNADREAAQRRMKQGKDLFASQQPNQAADAFAKAYASDSAIGEAHYYRARALFETGETKQARADLARALAGTLPSKETLLARALQLALDERHADAEPLLQAAAKQFPDDPFVRFNLGDWAFHAGNFEVAVTEMRAVIAMNDHFAPAHLHLYWALENLGKLDEAVAAARAWTLAMPGPSALPALVEGLYVTGDFAGALAVLDKAAPTVGYGITRADVLVARGDIAGARGILTDYLAVGNEPGTHATARSSLAWLEGRVGRMSALHALVEGQRADAFGTPESLRYIEVIELLWKAARGEPVAIPEVVPSDAGVRGMLVYAATLAKDFSKARTFLTTDGQADPFTPRVIDGEEHLAHHRYAEALAAFEPATKGFRNARIWAHYGVAKSAFALGQWERVLAATAPIATPHAFRPQGFYSIVYPQALLLQARAYAKLGDTAKTRERYATFRALWNDADATAETREADAALAR